MKTASVPPYIAKVIKEKAGAEYLAGWNLSEAEAKFGPGLLNNIISATARIDYGRKGFAIIGKEREGRISYENGIVFFLKS
jgi:hypothetical protein